MAELDARTATAIGKQIADRIADHLERNTAAILTLASVIAMADRQALPKILSDQAAKEFVLELFNQFPKPMHSRP